MYITVTVTVYIHDNNIVSCSRHLPRIVKSFVYCKLHNIYVCVDQLGVLTSEAGRGPFCGWAFSKINSGVKKCEKKCKSGGLKYILCAVHCRYKYLDL